jgi:hypothetical protein
MIESLPTRLICGVEFVFPDYKEPLVQLKGAVPGYMRGTLPYAVSDGRLPCAFCDPSKTHHLAGGRPADNLFDWLGKHVASAHGLSAQQYRDAIGLMGTTPLVSRRFAMKRRSSALAHGLDRNFKGNLGRPSATTLEARRAARRSNSVSPESLNKRGVCRDQLLDVAKRLAKTNGGVLRAADLARQGISSWPLRHHGWATIRALALEVGAVAQTRNWTHAELRRAFRELAERLGRIPSSTDLRLANGTASPTTYLLRFGSLTETARRCGLPSNLPRPLAEGDDIDILNRFAIGGNYRRVAQNVHRTQADVLIVLLKYGVTPSLVEAERRKAQAWAAEMARRLAGVEARP